MGGRQQGRVTDPRPVPTPAIWGLLLATIVPALYVLWVGVAIPIAASGEDVSAAEETSFIILSLVAIVAAFLAVILGAIGVLMKRRDPHLFRWQWVGWLAIALGLIEALVYVGGWLDWWPSL